MHCTTKISKDLYYIGGSDRRLALFENIYPLTNGVSYNSYLLCDEKTVLFDTVDNSIATLFFENVEFVLGDRELDYLIVNHMEPDHCSAMSELVRRYPNVKIVGNSKTLAMIKQFHDFDVDSRFVTVKEGDTLGTGSHELTFAMAPMVHWPEAMVTYDMTDKVLFSADAFGTFGALSGNIFADAYNFETDILPEARRYYTNIVGKYGNQVQALLKKAAKLEIAMICPLHGPVWRKDIPVFIEKYAQWSAYKPEETAVMIAYASIYGGTENAAEILAAELAQRGVGKIAVYDVSKTDPSYIVSEAFRCSHLVFASSTYNAGIFSKMETVLLDIKAHNLQNRTVALIENGTWAPTSGELMREIFSKMKNITLLDDKVSIKSTVKYEQRNALSYLADSIKASMPSSEPVMPETTEKKIDNNAIFKISYGLFVLSVKDGDKDNGCIINTAMLVTDTPKQLVIAVNKANLTHDMLIKTGVCNLSVLSEDADFGVFENFGFQSGRTTEKFIDYTDVAENGLRYVKDCSNAVISAKVVDCKDLGTHTLFTLEVTEAKLISSVPSATYTYYLEHIKPKPQALEENKKGWVCKICGYVYEGDSLPADFICPLCKHGIEDFEPLK